jgi:hypothetical protein
VKRISDPMIPFIEFILEFSNRTSLSTIQMMLVNICPFDHLPRTILKENSKHFSLKVYFPETEYLEKCYDELEMKKKELTLLLTQNYDPFKVNEAEIGIITQSEYEKAKKN